MSYTHTPGKTTVAPDVLITITRLSALSVPGVSRMAKVTGGVNRFFKRGVHDGVRLEIKDNTVFANLYLILKNDVNIREVSRNVQGQVAWISARSRSTLKTSITEIKRLSRHETAHQGSFAGPASTL
jgi:uncharacterized alkaline shock family protein YloU